MHRLSSLMIFVVTFGLLLSSCESRNNKELNNFIKNTEKLSDKIEKETANNKRQILSLETQELRTQLKQIVLLERRYYQTYGQLVEIQYGKHCEAFKIYNPDLNGSFRYRFDPSTGIATGIECLDVDGDGVNNNDGLTLSINWESGKLHNSEFFWSDYDIEDFKSRRKELTEQL